MFEWVSFIQCFCYVPQGNIKPGLCRSSRLPRHRSALIGDPEDNPVLAAAPTSRNASPQMFPAAFRRTKMEPNLSVTSGSTSSQSLESDLTLSSDNDGDEDICSSAFSTSLPSPEIFRREISGMWYSSLSSTTVQAYSVLFTYVYRGSTIFLPQGRGGSSQ